MKTQLSNDKNAGRNTISFAFKAPAARRVSLAGDFNNWDPEDMPMLRSIKQLYGNKLGASDGEIGHIKDFMMDAQSWAIGQLVVKTGHRLSGKESLIPTKLVDRVSYDQSTVFANLTGEAVGAKLLTPSGSCRCGRLILTGPTLKL